MSAQEDSTALQVCIRFRPLGEREVASGVAWTAMTEYSTVCETGEDNKPIKDSGATFDKVYGGEATTEQVYKDVGSALVGNAMRGINGTVFAYGMTSSGKTFTMQGDGKKNSSTVGFIELAARQIFEHVENTPEREFLLRLSYVEIYNEVIRDLLQPDKKLGSHLKIHVNPRTGPFVNSTSVVVTDAESIMDALRRGDQMREVNATDINFRSSRSHTIFKIMIESKERSERRLSGDDDVDGAILESHLNLVDLAGSENVRHTGAEGTRLKEAGQINKSLLTLSRVIKQIGSGAGHINFRDSKLTHILQPSLAGNCKTALIACATPASCFREETRTTLAFAQRAKLIKTSAKVNETLDEDCQLRRMKKDLRDARRRQKQMEEQLNAMQSGKTQEEIEALRDALQETKDLSKQQADEKEAADKKYENLKKLVLTSVMNAGRRKRDAATMNAKGKSRRRHSMLPSALLGIRGSDFTVRDEDDAAFDALGLISSVAAASPSLKKAKLQKEAAAAADAQAEEERQENRIKGLEFELDVLRSRLETQTKRHEESDEQQAQLLTEAKDRVASLESDLEDQQAALATLKDQFAAKEVALAEQVDRIQSENTDFASQLEEAAEAKAALAAELELARTEAQEATAKVKAAEADTAAAVDAKAAELAADLEAAAEATRAAEAKAEEQAAEVERLRAVVEANEVTNAELMATFEETVGQLEESTVAQNALAEKYEAARKEISELQGSQSSASQLQVVVQEQEAKNAELMATFEETVAQLEESTSAKTAAEAKLAETMAANDILKKQFDQAQTTISEKDAKINEQAATNAELMATFDETVAQLEAVTEARTELESQLESAQAEAAAMALDSNAGVDELEELKSNLATVEGKLTEAEAAYKTALEEKAALEEAAKAHTDEITDLKETNSVLSFEMQGLEDEKAAAEAKVTTLEATVSKLEAEVASQTTVIEEATAARDEMSNEMEEVTADLVAKAETLKQQEEQIKKLEAAAGVGATHVEENLRLQQETLKAQKEIDELRMELSAVKSARETAEAAHSAALAASSGSSEQSVALSNQLQMVQQQVLDMKAEAASRQVTWAEREADLTAASEKAAAELVSAKQHAEALQDELNVATQNLEMAVAELAETKEKLAVQIARVNADVNEATQIQSSEEAARKAATQSDTANGLMKQELEKKENQIKELQQRVKELEGMMLTADTKLQEAEETAAKVNKVHVDKVAALEHDINRLRSQGSADNAEQARRLEFLEKQHANLTTSAQANTQEVIEKRKEVQNLTAKCERYQQSIAKMDARCDELRNEVREKSAFIQELERRVEEQTTNSASMDDVRQLEDSNERLKLAVAALERRVQKQKTELAEAAQKLQDQDQRLGAAQEELETAKTAAADAAAAAAGSGLAQDLEAALEQRNAAQKKVGELSNTVKKLRASFESTKLASEAMAEEKDALVLAVENANKQVNDVTAELAEKSRAENAANQALAAARSACDKLTGEVDSLKQRINEMETAAASAADTSTSSTGTTAEEKLLELQQEVEYQNTVLQEREAEVATLQKQVQKAQQAHEAYAVEQQELQASVDAWTRKYAMHKAKALEQYEAVAQEAARLAASEADLRAQNASLATKVREQASHLRDQRAAIADDAEVTAAQQTIDVLKQEVHSERARVREQAQRIAKLEAVKLTNDQVQKLMALKKEHKKFKKENKTLRETVQNLTAAGSSSRGSRTRSGAADADADAAAERIATLSQEIDELRDAVDSAAGERDELASTVKKQLATIEASEKENAQLKDKLLRADVSISEAYKEKEAQFLKEIKYLENENLELMEEISALREAAVQRDESVTLNIPSLTKFLADSPVSTSAKNSSSSSKGVASKSRTPLATRSTATENVVAPADTATKRLPAAPATTQSGATVAVNATNATESSIAIHNDDEEEDDDESPGECTTQ